MPKHQLKWIYLICLSLIWGSSFILMKKGLEGLSALQVGAFRIVSAGFFLFIISFHKIKKIKKTEWKWVVLTGLLGTFFPAFLFAYGETEIDSSIVSVINSMVPILTLIIGIVFFGTALIKKQFLGVTIGFLGAVMLIISGASAHPNQDYMYALFPVLATVMYAFNANIIKRFLQDVPVFALTVGSFLAIWPCAVAVLFFTGFFKTEFLQEQSTQTALIYVSVLGVAGTGIAKVMFYRLVQISNTVFSTSFTYLIPIVAILWGMLYGEHFSPGQLFSILIILAGVFLSSKRKTAQKRPFKRKIGRAKKQRIDFRNE